MKLLHMEARARDTHAVAWFSIVPSFVSRVAALFVLIAEQSSTCFPAQWPLQFTVLLSVSMIATVAIVLYHDRQLAIVLVMLQFIVDLILCAPEGDRLIVRFLLFSPDVLVASLCLRPSVGVTAIAGMIASIYLLMTPVVAWNMPPSNPSVAFRVGFVFLMGVVGAFGLLQKQFLLHSMWKQEELSRRQTIIAQLARANVGFQQYARYVEQQSAEVERKRITRDIHDAIGYTLTNIIVMVQEAKLRVGCTDPELGALLETTRIQAQDGLQRTREALRSLRAIGSSPIPLDKAVAKLARSFENATGVKVRIDLGNLPVNVESDATGAVCSMVQEGLTNAIRHGKATRIRIHFWIDERKTLIIDLLDNGSGSGHFEEGIGLAGMRERIEAVGGTLSVANGPCGFQVLARMPMRSEEKSGA